MPKLSTHSAKDPSVAHHARTIAQSVARRDGRLGGFVPGTSVSLLTAPSKMPGYSWSLPAVAACPFLAGDICTACYARKGRYIFGTVQNAQRVRFDWTRDALKTPDGCAQWVDTMTHAIRTVSVESKYFRVHDSGDMFSGPYAAMWWHVARQLPRVKFWIPTRAWQHPVTGPFQLIGRNTNPVMVQLIALAQLPNVTVRPSALNFGELAPRVVGLHAGTTSDSPVTRACPAPRQGNQCGTCRTCWTAKQTEVSYARH